MTDNHDTTEPTEAGEGAQAPDDFAHLAAEANALEGGPPAPGTPEAEASQALTLAENIAANTELIEFGFGCIAPMLPERYAIRYGRAERERIADAYTRLAMKRGWDMGELFDKWGAEIALVVAVAGPGLPVFLADVKKRKEGGASDGHGQAAD